MMRISVQLDMYFDGEINKNPGKCEESFRGLMDDIFQDEDSYVKTEAKIKEIGEVIG